MKIGSLCSGYGGLDLAVEAYYNAETVWMSDLDKYASKVIQERWQMPNLGDLKTVDWATVEPIDILTAGYPCQPFSNAGQRKGSKDERHIWPYIKDIISQLQPKRVILENVRGHLTLGFKEVLADLTEIGYDAKWAIIRASDVGAPHQRARLFVIAYPNSSPSQQLRRANRAVYGEGSQIIDGSNRQITGSSCEIATNTEGRWSGLQPERDKPKESQLGDNSKIATHTNDIEQQRNRETQRLGSRFDSQLQMRLRTTPNPLDINGKLNAQFVEYMMGLPVGWVTDLEISRSQQLKLLGNGVVPQQAYYAISKLERL
jgi:DNA (cytosine-5)-methyltransferase 1